MAVTEYEDLNLHVTVCQERYDHLSRRLDNVEAKVVKLETQLVDVKASMQEGFARLHLALEQDSNRRTQQLIATAGSIVVAIIGLVGYIILH